MLIPPRRRPSGGSIADDSPDPGFARQDLRKSLIAGRLPAIPGNSGTFVPVVTVDYLARFLTLLPVQEETRGRSYWILDDETPVFPELLQLIGRHHNVRVPKLRMPVGIVKRLPQAITGADPETLSFLSPERYPTGPAQRLAEQHGLAQPDITVALTRWSDYLVSTRFGEVSARTV